MPPHNDGYNENQAIALGDDTKPWATVKSINYWASKARREVIEINTSGTLDVTTLIQEGLQAARSAGADVYFPPGDYGISDRLIQLSGGQSLAIFGAGRQRTRFMVLEAFDDPIFHMEGTVGTRQSNFQLSNVGFECGDHDVLPLYFKYASQAQIENILVEDCPNSAVVGESWWDSVLWRCDFASGGTATVPMIWLKDELSLAQNCNNIVFDTCRIELCAGIGIKFGDDARDNAVINCKIEGGNNGITFVEGARLNLVAHSSFRNLGAGGGIIGVGGVGWRIVDNQFSGIGAYALDMDGDSGPVSTNCIITGNLFGEPDNNTNNIRAADASNKKDNNNEV